jgi:RNA polymerase sigma factor (sigma-70 family)
LEQVIPMKAKTAQVQTPSLERTVFEGFYSTYLPKIYNYVCYRVGDEKTAEDITAEIFMRALTRLDTYKSDRGAFSTWLFSIAHNYVINYWRTKSRQPETCSLDSISSISGNNVTPEQAAIHSEQWHHIQTAMRKLPEQQQEILALKFGLDLSNQEIAHTMKLKPNHVGVLLYRAVHALRSVMEVKEETK